MNPNLFKQAPNGLLPAVADTTNAAGGRAYSMTAEGALAQLCITGTFGDSFYASAEFQLEQVLTLCDQVSPEYIAKLAVYCYTDGLMKDSPIVLLAKLSMLSPALFSSVFDRIIKNGKSIRNLVKVIRSGVVGRKSMGSLPKRKVAELLQNVSDYQLIRWNEGDAPSLSAVLKTVHPKADTAERNALFRWIRKTNKPEDLALLPTELATYLTMAKDYPAFVASGAELPDVPFLMLTVFPLTPAHMSTMFSRMTWSQLRQNLMYMQTHNLFNDAKFLDTIADRLRDRNEIIKARVFPYQIFNAWNHSAGKVPAKINLALQDALDIALNTTPVFAGKRVHLLPDISNSMRKSVSGRRGSATSAVRNVDVCGLFISAILRVNPTAEVLAFGDRLYIPTLNPRDSVVTNTQVIASMGAGGTACHLPIAYMLQERVEADLVVMISDNESWIQSSSDHYQRSTDMQTFWNQYKAVYPNAKLVCWDISPNVTTQVSSLKDSLNVGGFSDSVFKIIAKFVNDELTAEGWISEVHRVEI